MNKDETSDHELLRAWCGGDDRAGTLLVRRHFESLSRFFRGRVQEDRVDLMQKTWLGCTESRERVPPDVPFRAYLMGIARRVLLQHYREQKKTHLVEPAEDASDPANSPSAEVAMAAEENLLLHALRKLPLDIQLTLELYYWEELAIDEIALALEVPSGTVKSRLHRGRALIREQIDTLNPAPELAESTAANLEHWARSLRRFLGRTTNVED